MSSKKTHCVRGHELTAENRYPKNGHCKLCNRLRATEWNKSTPIELRYKKCKHGHQFTPENTVRSGVIRLCATCIQIERENGLHSSHPDIAERRYYYWKYKYGVTREQYDAMHAKQDGKCAICGNPETKKNYKTNELMPLHVDHDHKTMEFRGLLCAACNRAIGLLGDHSARVFAAAEYLSRHENKSFVVAA